MRVSSNPTGGEKRSNMLVTGLQDSSCGAEGNRTPDPFHAMEVLCQLFRFRGAKPSSIRTYVPEGAGGDDNLATFESFSVTFIERNRQ